MLLCELSHRVAEATLEVQHKASEQGLVEVVSARNLMSDEWRGRERKIETSHD